MMGVDEFVRKMGRAPDHFLEFWLDGHREKPSDWPLSMNQADWLEQFMVWLEAQA
jgi:hypothetical protein